MKNKWLGLAIIAAMFVLGAATYRLMPAQMPSRWDARGEVTTYLSRFWGVWLLPTVTLGVWMLFQVLPRLDPRGENYASFLGTYRLFINVLVLFLAGVYGVTLAAALGWNMPINKLITAGVGLLFATLGNELGRVQPNFFVGIRTPWTLADPEVWRQTHRVGGRVMVAVGLAHIAAALLLPETWQTGVVIMGTLIVALGSVAYSFVVWRRLQSERSSTM